MGGKAFQQRGLATPRMPPALYEHSQATIQALLRQHYSYVASPLDAPGKLDYGDIDILVCDAADPAYDVAVTSPRQVAESLAVLLNAKSHIQCSGNPTMNFAIPFSSLQKLHGGDHSDPIFDELESDGGDTFIQLDIHHCPSPSQLTYTLFHHAHGDLWNVLGSTIRPFGLTINDRGLFLRIPSIEWANRKKSLVFLTADPAMILDFLGLKADRFWERFDGIDELFGYASECRMFWVKDRNVEEVDEGTQVGKPNNSKEEDDDDGLARNAGAIGTEDGGEDRRKKLKHNDRQRMAKRPLFAAWIDEYIPRCQKIGKLGNPAITRELIRDDAFARFQGVQQEYEETEREWALERHKDMIWRIAIKETVPSVGTTGLLDPSLRAASIRMLKSILMEGQEDEGKVVEASKTDRNGFWNTVKVRQYVTHNWERLGREGLLKQHMRAVEGMKAKAEKQARAKVLNEEINLVKQADRM